MATAPSLGSKYRLNRLLGTGTAGAVWEAENTLVGRRVAIKILHAAYAEKPEVHARFLAEARAAARIAHKNVVDVFDLGEADDGRPFIVMELLSGETLDGVISRGATGAGFAAELLVQVLGALEAAHALDIVHRDLKPANVMIVHPRPDKSVVKVLDFGIAQGVVSDEHAPDESGQLFGTPAYMAPEQALGERVDARSDLYAAGGILYELLTGQAAFPGDDAGVVLSRVLTRPPIPPKLLVPSIPSGLERVVLSALAKSPADRPATAREMMNALMPFCHAHALPSIAPPPAAEQPIPLIAKSPRAMSIPDPEELRRASLDAAPASPRPKKKLELVISPSTVPPPGQEPPDGRKK